MTKKKKKENDKRKLEIMEEVPNPWKMEAPEKQSEVAQRQ